MIKYAKFQLYRAYPVGVIWKKPTTDGKYVNKRVWLFLYIKQGVIPTWSVEKNMSAVWCMFNKFTFNPLTECANKDVSL